MKTVIKVQQHYGICCQDNDLKIEILKTAEKQEDCLKAIKDDILASLTEVEDRQWKATLNEEDVDIESVESMDITDNAVLSVQTDDVYESVFEDTYAIKEIP